MIAERQHGEAFSYLGENLLVCRDALRGRLICSSSDSAHGHHRHNCWLPATLDTIQWGYFDGSIDPVLRVRSGDYVEIECLCHHAGDAPDYLMDDAIREICEKVPEDTRAPGVHILTDPIDMEDAEPSDTLEEHTLPLAGRLNRTAVFVDR